MSIATKFEAIADAVYEKGKTTVEDAFMSNGQRYIFTYAFAYTDLSGYEFLRPIKPTHYINHMFYNSTMTSLPKNLDFSALFTYENTKGEKVKDDFAYRRAVFGYCASITEIDLSPNGLNMKVIGGVEGWFQGCSSLTTIIGLNVDENTIFGTESFDNCFALKNITFSDSSVIGQDINFVDCNLLTKESLTNIAEHLKDFSGESGTGNVRTIIFHDTVKNYLLNDPDGQAIASIIAAKRWGDD